MVVYAVVIVSKGWICGVVGSDERGFQGVLAISGLVNCVEK